MRRAARAPTRLALDGAITETVIDTRRWLAIVLSHVICAPVVHSMANIGITAFQNVTYNWLLPNVALPAVAKEGDLGSESITYQLADSRVSHAITPAVAKLYTREFDDNQRVMVVPHSLV